ncbi:helix-hairpin-helix domain-containing protein [Candidatus Deferrimicrobium sp.]|uniref:ComEA family DNA-binding protein n=1 Tax=Candidatus Deferrimicrobium sp. TaxID=3060586 RepID=UPI002ED25585
MPIQGSRKCNGGKRRAVLLLSLILLVWNAFATAQRVVSIGLLPAVNLADGSPVLPFPSGIETGVLSAESPRCRPLTIRQQYLLGKRIDINRASLQEISELPGISDKIAAAVVEERDRVRGFRVPEDLLGVKGIKEKRLQKILPFLAKMPNN